MRVEADAFVPRPAAEVWQRLIQWERQPEWMKDAGEVRVLTPRREGRGVRVAVKTRLFGIPLLTEALEVVEWDEPRRLRVAHRSFIRGFGEWALADIDGGTRLRWVEDVSMPISGLGELALRAYRPFLRRSMGGSLTALVAAMAAD